MKIIKKCQICNFELTKILNLGKIPLVNDLGNKKKKSYPLILNYCTKCTLGQINIHLDKSILFPKTYPYTSSTTNILKENFKNLSVEINKTFKLNKNKFLVDIGSNDGNLLSFFKNKCKILGITPEDIGKTAIKKGIPTLLKYFDEGTVKEILKKYSKADFVTATNVFAHIDGVHNVIKNIKLLLKKNGVFVSENHYFLSVIKEMQYDTIYHEHMRYYSLTSLDNLFKIYDLEIFHAKLINSHGGSIRVYAAKKNLFKKTKSLKNLFIKEKKYLNIKFLKKFKHHVYAHKKNLINLINKYKLKNYIICGVGAPSRASTLINYCKITNKLVPFVFEIDGSSKIGKNVPGTQIKIVSEKSLKKINPDLLILFSWHISNYLIKRIKYNGYKGRFLIPLKTPKIIR
jgi:2-polyprenyl-3-methyl-5-hydroxy-6-metoxy-1,4-benzoquinol methylase